MIKGAKVFNLFTSDENIISKECEVCIVGAGAAGIYLAVNLASKGIDTILLEAGDIISTNSSDAGFEVNFEDELYSGATKGR
jgi:flavin-dependent dehydrogenase